MTELTENAVSSPSLSDVARRFIKSRSDLVNVSAAVVNILSPIYLPSEPEDILVDGGNSRYIEDIRRAKEVVRRESITPASGRADFRDPNPYKQLKDKGQAGRQPAQGTDLEVTR